MEIVVNGQRREVPPGTTIAALLERLELSIAATVAQRNGEIVDRSAYADTVLAAGDTLELVRFVGGG